MIGLRLIYPVSQIFFAKVDQAIFQEYEKVNNAANYHVNADANSENKPMDKTCFQEAIDIAEDTFVKLIPLMEKELFYDRLISPTIPEEFQETQIALYKHFIDRFKISSRIVAIAVVQYSLEKSFSTEIYQDGWNEFVLSSLDYIISIRLKVENFNPTPWIKDPSEKIENVLKKEAFRTEFIRMNSERVSEIYKLLGKEGDARRLAFCFRHGVGQIFPEKGGMFYSPLLSPIINQGILDAVYQTILYFGL